MPTTSSSDRWSGSQGLPLLAAAALAATLAACTQPQRGQPVDGRAPGVPGDFRATLDSDERSVRNGSVQWRTRWILNWSPVPGAKDCVVQFGTSEGTPTPPRTRRTVQPRFAIEAAAGTSPARRVAQDRSTQLLFTGSQLRVRVSAVDGAGRAGRPSPWFAVGEGATNGVPVPHPEAGSGHD